MSLSTSKPICSHSHHLFVTVTLFVHAGFFNDVFPPVVRFVPAHMIEGEDNEDDEY